MSQLLVINPSRKKRHLRRNPDLLVINPAPPPVAVIATLVVSAGVMVAGALLKK
jgi:hypothetical protein